MLTIWASIKRHPLVTYYILTFGISWSSMLLVVGGPRHILGTPDEFKRLLPLVALALMPGPSVAGVLLTGLVSGRAGYRDLAWRLFRWRVDARWYVVALLSVPVLLAIILLMLSLFSAEFLPPVFTTHNWVPLLLLAIAAGLTGSFLEELGWTGFVIPRLKQRHGVLATGLIVGVLWGAGHFLVNVWSSPSLSGGLSPALFVPLYFLAGVAQLTAYRVLMVWVYDRTESLLIATLMHASLIVSTVQTILTPATTGVAFLTWFFLLTAALWILVAAISARNRGELSRRQARRRAA